MKLALKIVINYSLLILGIFSFIIGIVNRDVRFRNAMVEPTAEFSSDQMFCTDFPECFRQGGFLLGNAIRILFAQLLSLINLLGANPDYPWTDYDQVRLNNIMVSVGFRVIALIPLTLYFCSLLKKVKLPILFAILIGLTIIFSTFPMYVFNSWFGAYFTISDYGSFFALGIILITLNRSTGLHFLLIPFAALFFENLGLVLFIGLAYAGALLRPRTLFRLIPLLALAGFAPLILMVISAFRHSAEAVSFPPAGLYLRGNLDNLPKIMLAIAFLLALPYLLGRFILFNLRKWYAEEIVLENNIRRVIKGMFLGFLFSYFIGLVNSGLSAEGSRQTLGGQLLAFILGLTFERRQRKDLIQGNHPQIMTKPK
jgi:hypothetical protein